MTRGNNYSNNYKDDVSRNLDVTNTRVSALENNIRDLANAQHQLGVRLTADISTISQNLSTEIKGLAGQLADRGKIPWPALAFMLAFITTVGGLVWYPVNLRLEKSEQILERMTDAKVSYKEFEMRLTTAAQRRDDYNRMQEAKDEKTEAKIEKIREAIVPRGEHEEKWRGNDQRFTEVQRQIDALKGDFAGLYSPRDALASIQRRVDELSRELRDRSAPPARDVGR